MRRISSLEKCLFNAADAWATLQAHAADERLGPVYPVIESDMLKEIYRVLGEKEKSGELARLQDEALGRSKQSIENPKPVMGLSKTEQARTFYWDPMVRVPQTIQDPSGNVIAEAGKTVNPLDYVNLSKHLFFFDGSDPVQVRMAFELYRHYKGAVKAVLVAGRPLALSRQWKFQVYFDQGGFLVRKLGIAHVPALVSQERDAGRAVGAGNEEAERSRPFGTG
ncbi:MAG: type-F conjugative transfer system protein TraW [Azoarcus sp.]|jgi:conjugal transfer pilus assembly protein TraW|nr:type-F conjugative transfer system protein TraW [Azoarcus sp.]